MLFSCLEPIAGPVILFFVPLLPHQGRIHPLLYLFPLLYSSSCIVQANFSAAWKMFNKSLFFDLIKNQKLSVLRKRKIIRKCLWKVPSF